MRTPKPRIIVLLLVVSAVILFVVNPRTLSSPGRTNSQDLAVSPIKLIRDIGFGIKRIMPFARLREENERLRGEIALLNRKAEESKLVQEENGRLKDLLGFRKAIPFGTIPAEVIGRDASNWSNSVIIDKGSTQGIRQNKAVISNRGLVGRVLEVGRYSSRILLITDPNSKVGVVIGRNRQGGMLTGRPDGKCKMLYIALDSDVAIGDRVVTAGFGSVFPRGILVGEVIEIGREPGRLYKFAIIKPAQDMSKLEEVLCIR